MVVERMATAPIRPHAIALPLPEQGHLNGMLQLCYRLASKGFLITFVTLEFFHKRIITQATATITTAGFDFHFIGLKDDLPIDLAFSGFPTFQIRRAFANALNEFETLILKLKNEEPLLTCYVADFTHGWAQHMANRCQVPRVCFSAVSAATYTLYTHVPEVISSGYHPFKDKVKYGSKSREPMDLVIGIPGLPPMHPADLCYKHSRIEEFAIWLSALRLHETEVAWTLCNTFIEIEKKTISSLRMDTNGKFLSVGPLVPAFLFNEERIDQKGAYKQDGLSLLGAEDECLKWLDTQAPSSVLYISFGSLVELSNQQVQEIFLGLAASQQPFLFVIRSINQPCMVSIGGQESHAGRVVRWAPQAQVLAHPAVGGFLTHCGWNSVMESISAGIPMLGWPFWWDQFTNCWFMVNEWKIGIEIEWEEGRLVERKEVERAVRRLMQEEEGVGLRKRVWKLREEARSGRSSDTEMDVFVEDMRRRAETDWMDAHVKKK